jgi:hypothetical protein
MLWEDGLRDLVRQVEMGVADRPFSYATKVPTGLQFKANTCKEEVKEWHRVNRAEGGVHAFNDLTAVREALHEAVRCRLIHFAVYYFSFIAGQAQNLRISWR